MTEFRHVVRNRRMTRAFAPEGLDPALIDEFVDLASRAPSAGKTQGWHALVLEGPEQVGRYWDITLPIEKRASFRWTQLLDAPVLMIVLADPDAYVERYGEPDKERTGLGAGTEAWPAPYWTIDASMAAMTILLAAEDEGLGALFFGLFQNESEVRQEFAVPDRLQIIGVIALGLPAASGEPKEQARSADRPRRSPGEIIRRGRWQPSA
ncbi:nitroreductase family protein [Ilumatobacter nonamiensis]|uniref:nitroreductase family protein n=1 Tax=Ilumatobacter nonamiensis TaxID=467093 RepID=UPI00034CDBEC|nr:nitroreductase family protein [Ilumatobacter nonamiensis]